MLFKLNWRSPCVENHKYLNFRFKNKLRSKKFRCLLTLNQPLQAPCNVFAVLNGKIVSVVYFL